MQRPFALVTMCALTLGIAGCGGGTALRSAVPALASQAHRGVAHPLSSNVAAFSSSLWYGGRQTVASVPLAANGSGATLTLAPGSTVERAMNVASDGSIYTLAEANGTSSSASWRLVVYAARSQGTASPEQVISGTGHPQDVVLVADGIDVLASAATATGSYGAATLSTFAYAAGDMPKPIRTLSLGPNVSDVAADGSGRLYVAHGDGTGVRVYAAGAKGSAAPLRTIATSVPDVTNVAVAPDGTVYVAALAGSTVSILAYAASDAGPAPSRTLSFSGPAGTRIAVDSAGELYAGYYESQEAAESYVAAVFGSYASGSAQIGVIPLPALPAQDPTQLTSLAIGPGGAIAIPNALSKIYVAYPTHVDAYNIGANGVTPPARSDPSTSAVQAIATDAAGTLYAVTAYVPTNTIPGCRCTPTPGARTKSLA